MPVVHMIVSCKLFACRLNQSCYYSAVCVHKVYYLVQNVKPEKAFRIEYSSFLHFELHFYVQVQIFYVSLARIWKRHDHTVRKMILNRSSDI